MSDVLAKICADKRNHIKACKKAVPEADIRAQAETAPAPAWLCRCVEQKGRGG